MRVFLIALQRRGKKEANKNESGKCKFSASKMEEKRKKNTWNERMHSFFSFKSDDAFRFCPPSPYMSVGVRSVAAATVE